MSIPNFLGNHRIRRSAANACSAGSDLALAGQSVRSRSGGREGQRVPRSERARHPDRNRFPRRARRVGPKSACVADVVRVLNPRIEKVGRWGPNPRPLECDSNPLTRKDASARCARSGRRLPRRVMCNGGRWRAGERPQESPSDLPAAAVLWREGAERGHRHDTTTWGG